jgi:hypothetical protein
MPLLLFRGQSVSGMYIEIMTVDITSSGDLPVDAALVPHVDAALAGVEPAVQVIIISTCHSKTHRLTPTCRKLSDVVLN